MKTRFVTRNELRFANSVAGFKPNNSVDPNILPRLGLRFNSKTFRYFYFVKYWSLYITCQRCLGTATVERFVTNKKINSVLALSELRR